MAKPLFGTTATQAACLFAVLGADEAKEYYRGLQGQRRAGRAGQQAGGGVGRRGAHAGRAGAVGVTDTDDALDEIEAGHPVAMIFPDRDRPKDRPLGTLFIPNTLCIIKGGPNPEGARKLVDYLLSPEVEGRLAESASHQIPLNPQVKAKLPTEMETPARSKRWT